MSVLVKAAEIVEAIGRAHGSSRLGDLAAELGMPKSSLHRLLGEMVTLGVLRTQGDGSYQLGPRLIRWGRLSVDSFDLAGVAKPCMQMLRDATNETVNLYVPVDGGRVCVACESGHRALQHNPMLGVVRPVGRGAAGKLIMAYAEPAERARIRATVPGPLPTDEELDELRAAGVAISREEIEPGLVVLGAPLLVDGMVVAVLAVAGVTAIMTPDHVEELRAPLLESVERIRQSLLLGTVPEPAGAAAP